MSTAVAAPQAPTMSVEHSHSPRSYPALAPSASQTTERPDTTMSEAAAHNTTPNKGSPSDGKKSPHSARTNSHPKITVKTEPGSPLLQGRQRPRKLDLHTAGSTATTLANSRGSGTTPHANREGLVMQEVGLACLSPGFQTHDPTMREQLQRSIYVRDHQRSIIEARLLKSAKGEGPSEADKSPLSSAKKRPPLAGLSIVPPPAQQFANERVIQSAPLHKTFTGRNPPIPGQAGQPDPRAPAAYTQASHIQHVPAVQTSNRLPPISDVFGADTLQPNASRTSFQPSNSTPHFNGPPLPSPGFPPQTAHPSMQQSGRPREYRSAEEAVHEMTGGREDLQPKIVRYGGRQPPTPPSPKQDTAASQNHLLGPHNSGYMGTRRSRAEYEGGSSPPLGNGREHGPRTGPFGEGRDSPATQQAKKEEFLSLCSRAWDLFHS